ncbi:MAG: hypothetical protein ABIQ93_08775 [Saprospiraceae bacterium]
MVVITPELPVYQLNALLLEVFQRTGRANRLYYRRLQAKMVVQIAGQEIAIADIGPTDWARRLTGNCKERFMISGLGSRLLFKPSNATPEDIQVYMPRTLRNQT